MSDQSTAQTAEAAASFLDGREPIIVSNRQPYSHEYDGDEISVNRPAGGVTAVLDPMMQTLSGTWVAWGDGEADHEVVEDNVVTVPPEDPSYDLRRVWLDDDQVEGYYHGYSNRALWPIAHSDTSRAAYSVDDWEHYRTVNDMFAEAAIEVCDRDEPVVWFHDYHFGLAPRVVREQLPESFLMQFWHLPWPSWDVFRACPHAEKLLDGLLANDMIGFHTDLYCHQFLETADRLLDARVDYDTGAIRYRGGQTHVRRFRLGIDADEQADLAGQEGATEFWAEFTENHGIEDTQSVAVGVDRLDYTKGIVERLTALERLWETTPEWRGELTFVQKGTESRSAIPAYQRLQERVTSKVDEVNDRFGTEDWQPVIYTTEMLDRDSLAGLYRNADCCLVTSLRDGMNLVAKEYVASQLDDDGVLVLSELTGAFEQMGDSSTVIHPSDTVKTADAIERALTMDADDRKQRMSTLRSKVHEDDVYAWIAKQFRIAKAVEQGAPDTRWQADVRSN